MTKVGIVGCGYWGKNLVRVFDDLATVAGCYHTGTAANEQWMSEHYPAIPLTTDYEDLLCDDAVDALVIATPIDTHYDLARTALEHDLDVFVEKPLTHGGETARELAALAERRGRKLFTGYIFLHHPVYREVEAIHAEEYITAVRAVWEKTGPFREPILQNLGSHDVAIAYGLFGSEPAAVTLQDAVDWQEQRNIVSFRAEFGDGTTCTVTLNRLAAEKRKTVTFLTDAGRVYLWDDDELLRFDEGSDGFERRFRSTREPLELECRAFLEYVEGDRTPVTDGEFGATVSAILDRLD